MKIEIDNVWAKAVERTADEHEFLIDYLSFEETRFVARGGRSKRVAPKVHHLYCSIGNTFPAGLAPQVARVAREEGMPCELVDKRAPTFSPLAVAARRKLGALWLRDYQEGAVDRVLERRNGILSMPTGSGKTEVAIALAVFAPIRWLFLVHRKGLMKQAAERYELRTGDRAGIIGEGKWDERDFTCATFQTLSRALSSKKQEKRTAATRLLLNTQGLIIDECHVLPADSHWKVVMRAPNAYYRVGMSGTPLDRSDRRSLMAVAATGPVIYKLTPGELVEAGVLARPDIKMLPLEQESSCPTWQGVYGECVVRSAKRNQKLVDAVQRAEKPCLLFVKELKHGRELMARLGKAGLNADFAHGKHSTAWRKNLVKSLERGAIDVLVCTVIFQEGTDIPALESVVIGSGGKSAIAAIQRIGRGMRSNQGKKTSFEVFDVDDRGNKWLEKHTKERIRAYRAQGFEVSAG